MNKKAETNLEKKRRNIFTSLKQREKGEETDTDLNMDTPPKVFVGGD